jgi:uncharacterized protein YecT (DUF1311 family)
MNKMIKFILVIILCISTNFIFAQTQFEMNKEAGGNYLKADKELNLIYNKILKEYKSDTEFIKNLKASQIIWIKFRDSEMKVKFPDREVGYYGSIQPVCRYSYLEKLTKIRTNDLKVWLTGIEEGDVCSGSVKMKE